MDAVGEAPGSWSPPGGELSAEVVLDPLFYPEGLPDEQLLVGWGGYEVTSYLFEPQEGPGPVEQPEVLSPPLTPVSDEEAYRVLAEFLWFVGKVTVVVAVAVVTGPGEVLIPTLGRIGAAAGIGSVFARIQEARYSGDWPKAQESAASERWLFILGGSLSAMNGDLADMINYVAFFGTILLLVMAIWRRWSTRRLHVAVGGLAAAAVILILSLLPNDRPRAATMALAVVAYAIGTLTFYGYHQQARERGGRR